MKHNHDKYLNASKQTWLRSCNSYYVVESIKAKHEELSKIFIGGKPSHCESLDLNKLLDNPKSYAICDRLQPERIKIRGPSAWSNLCKALHFAKTKDLQWLMVSPDSSMVMIENLQFYVNGLDWKKAYYLGYALKNYVANYNILAAGILLSNGTLERLLSLFPTEDACDKSGKYWNNEDLYLGTV